jgi:hypothetical protein
MFETIGRILNEGAKFIYFTSTHGAQTLVDFNTYVELNKSNIIECPCESMAYNVVRVQ